MMLQALYRLAQRERLVDDPDYEYKPIAWLVTVDDDGRILGIAPTHEIGESESKKKKPKAQPKRFLVPRMPGRQSNDLAYLLFDKAEYVFGIDPSAQRDAAKLALRHSLWTQRVRDYVVTTGDVGATAVLRMAEAIGSGKCKAHVPTTAQSNDLFAFIYAPDRDMLVTDRSAVRSAWLAERSAGRARGNKSHRCIVTGLPCSAGGLVPALKRVPGGSSSGVALVSFNSGAFESHGWDKNENAPISQEAAEAIATAANRLLDPAWPDPSNPGQTLPPRHQRLSADTVVCFWPAETSGEEFASCFAGLFEANPDQVKALYQSVWSGRPPHIENPSAFYAMTLTGTQGRVIVRDWFESTVHDVAENLAAHFRDLDIVRNTPKPKDHDLPPQVPLTRLIEALAVRGDRDEVPAHIAAAMVRAALAGTPYPFNVLQRAVERARAEIGRAEWSDLDRRDARAALIKAVLNRNRRRHAPHKQEVTRDMSPNNAEPGYLLGQLLAVIERIQQIALGNVNASVVDRFFSGAAANPRSVFVRLLRNAKHHVRKAQDEQSGGGMAFLCDRMIDQLASGFNPNENGFPAFLDIEQQGLFILGYHHMRKWLWMGNDERLAWEQAHADAPRAYLWKTNKSETTAAAQ